MKKLSELMMLYLQNADGDLNFYGKLVKILMILVISRIIVAVVNIIIDRTIKGRKIIEGGMSKQRVDTLAEISKNIIKYIIYFISIIAILDMFINTNSILATAGIGGLAIGFGAQSLVKDVITGFFILLEDQYALGDHVKIDSYEGVVEELGVRVTKLRSFDGELHIIPNGKIEIVTNKNRGSMRAVVEIPVSYEENLDDVMRVLDKVCKNLENHEWVVSGPTILGVNKLSDSEILIAMAAQSLPTKQWDVQRLIRKEAKDMLDLEGIEIPYPRRVLIGGNDINA